MPLAEQEVPLAEPENLPSLSHAIEAVNAPGPRQPGWGLINEQDSAMRTLLRRSPFLVTLSLLLGLSLATAACGTGTVSHEIVAGSDLQRTENGMVVSANLIASRIGARVLEEGGNAVDAAVATGFALAVVHPSAGNIGGGGFMVIRFPDGETTALDFREKAPLAAHPEMFLDESGESSRAISHNSQVAVGVPGRVAG